MTWEHFKRIQRTKGVQNHFSSLTKRRFLLQKSFNACYADVMVETTVAVGGRSASVHAGIHPPGCGPGDSLPWVWVWRPPPSVGLETPHARPLNFPLWCGPGDHPGQTPQLPPWVWAWKPARHARIPLPPGDLLQCMVGKQPPPPWTESQTRVKT